MVNVYKIKVYAALILSPLITVISFFVVLNLYGFMWSLLGMMGGVLVSVVVAKLLINNPFSLLLEGAGILTINLDSTGIIRPFIVAVQSPYIKNAKEGVNDVFDRNAVYQFATPVQNRKEAEFLQDGGIRITLDKAQMSTILNKESFGVIELKPDEYRVIDNKKAGFFNKINPFKKKDTRIKLQVTAEALEKIKAASNDNITVITIDEAEYNAGRFAFFHYPCLLYNDQIKSIITKDFLSNQEKEAFAEHTVLYLNRKMEELTSAIREFGRYVVELLKPKEGLFSGKWVWIILAVFIVGVIGFLIYKYISSGDTSGAGGAISAVKGAMGGVGGGGGTITPQV